jgi:hypothetical protein
LKKLTEQINEIKQIGKQEKALISFLEKIGKEIPKAIKIIKADKIGDVSSNVQGLVQEMISANDTDWYDHFWS